MGANAVTTFPTYTTGQVLEAADLNITNCGVPVFAGTVERDAAFGGTGEKTLAEGQLCYLESTNVVQYYDGSSWATVGPTSSGVVQVKSTTKTDTFTMTSATYADITGLSVSITPTSASNKIYVIASLVGGGENTVTMAYARLMRDSTAIGIGDAASNRVQCTVNLYAISAFDAPSYSLTFLDSPATTSATTYKVQIRREGASGNVFVNRGNNDPDSAAGFRAISTITAMEVLP